MKIDFSKIKKLLKRILNVFWQNLFLILILFFLVDIALGAVLFYTYYFTTEQYELPNSLTLTINQDLMDSIFSEWDGKEAKLQQASEKEFPNFFQNINYPTPPATTTPATTTPATTTQETSTSTEETTEETTTE